MKKKVLIVATSMDLIGGQSIQAKRLLDAFADDKEIELGFVPNNPNTLFQNVKILRTVFASLKFWWLLLKNIYRYDAVQVFSSATTGYIIATLPPLFIAKLFGKKVILNYHSGEAEEHIKNWKLTAKPTMKMFDKIVVPSQFLVDVFAKFDLPAEAVSNFVDTEKFKFRERKNLQPVFLSNRNFEAHYNVSCVIRAFSEIQKKFPDARLIIAGFGSEEAKQKDLAIELKLKNFDFVGKIPNEEMPKLYDEADIYLNSSVVDNMPLSLIEAFSAGIPVVSSNAGGIPYIVKNGETGLLVEKNDYQGLAEQAIKLLQNQALTQKIITQAKKEVEKYSTEKVVESWRRLFLEI